MKIEMLSANWRPFRLDLSHISLPVDEMSPAQRELDFPVHCLCWALGYKRHIGPLIWDLKNNNEKYELLNGHTMQ